MKTHLSMRRAVLVASLALMGWPLPPSMQAADQPSKGVALSVPAAPLRTLASGATEDTLKACLARIPKDASPGQRMIAEQSCGHDEDDRKLIQAVPGR